MQSIALGTTDAARIAHESGKVSRGVMKERIEPVELHLSIRVVPGQVEALKAFLYRARPYYEAPGNIRVRLLQSVEDPDSFIEIISYADSLSYRLDQERVQSDPQMIALIAEWRSLLAAPPVLHTYRILELVLVDAALNEPEDP